MAETTGISWADATFNPWIGCTKVSPACDHCYAEALATTRLGVEWGPKAERRRTAASTWKHPLAWNRKAEREGRRIRVFCASLADVFDNQVPQGWRDDLWALIRSTPNLDWLLLTKRPQNIAKMLPLDWGAGYPNVWLGTTVENQAEADRRIPHLLAVPARIRFLSCEPLLGPVDIRCWTSDCYECGATCGKRLPGPPDVERCYECGEECGPETEPVISEGCPKCGGELDFICPNCGHYMVHQHPDTPVVNWVITGGESGPKARPSHPDWFRSLRDQCAAAGVAFHMKQWGEWAPVVDNGATRTEGDGRSDGAAFHKGEWLHFPAGFSHGDVFRLGTKRSGHLLDGQEHRAVPA